eukprot:11094357-Heterocapsa_arctica.AAC.1
MAWDLACKGLRNLALPHFQRRQTSIPHDRRDNCRSLHNRILQMREQSLRDRSFRACAHLAAPIMGTCSGLCTLRLVMRCWQLFAR